MFFFDIIGGSTMALIIRHTTHSFYFIRSNTASPLRTVPHILPSNIHRMRSSIFFLLGMLSILLSSTTSFVAFPPLHQHHTTVSRRSGSSMLQATKKKKKRNNNNNNSGGGFGGAAMEPCPCGSSNSYSQCCGKLHKDVNAYKSASASQVVRARYSAYAKKQAEFLMATTHPLHKDFNTDLKQWKEQIKLNMYDNFDLEKCHIVEENYDEEGDTKKASVQFVAEMMLRESGETTGFMETSQFERAKTHGGWLYLNGTMAAAPEELLVKNLDTTRSSTSKEE